MLVGVLDTWRYQRRAFWENFLTEVGAKILKPQSDFGTSLINGRNLMPKERQSVQLLVGRLTELIDADAILIPDLNPDCEPLDNDDPWTADLSAVLQKRFSLPPLINVPIETDEEKLLSFAVGLGQNIVHNGQIVRLALMRTQHLFKPKRPNEPKITGKRTVGVVASPILLEEPFLLRDVLSALEQANFNPVSPSYLPIDHLIEYGKKFFNKLRLNTDFEIAGAAHIFDTKAMIKGLVFIKESKSAKTGELIDSLAEKSRKPSIILEVNSEQSVDNFADQLIQWTKNQGRSV